MSEPQENKQEKEVKKGKKTFVERIFHDDIEGEYDDEGFFTTPNGSFWDPDGVYFNREGYDKHGGYYDDNDEYVPGKGWDEENNCYKDELNEDEFASDHEPDEEENDGFGDVDLDKIQDEEKLIKVSADIEKMEEVRIKLSIILRKMKRMEKKIKKRMETILL